jgi:N-acetylglucosaminyl-diphospho-decaprenol L-rhamnosyltransferase
MQMAKSSSKRDGCAVAPQPIPTEVQVTPDVTIIIVSYNTEHLLKRMFDALDASRGALRLQIIVVDNASRDGSAQLLRTTYQTVELIENKINVGFGRANNQAVSLARGRYILLLNTDAFVSPDTLTKTVAFMDAHPRCGVLGVKLIGSDGSLQPSCRYFPTPWNLFVAATGFARFFPTTRMMDDMSWDHGSVRYCDWVPGCYYLVRREVIERIGLFDPRYFMYLEEVDHCRAARLAGWSIVYYPYTEVVHIGGESAASHDAFTRNGRRVFPMQIESELLYFRKHYGISGLLSSVFLIALGDIIIAAKALVRRLDIGGAALAMYHAYTLIKLIIKTRLASHATR